MIKTTSEGAGAQPAPLTSAQKQRRRVAELDAIAQARGWYNIGTALTALKRGVVKLPRKPKGYDDRPAKEQEEMNGTQYYEKRSELLKQLKYAGVEQAAKQFPLITDKADMLQCERDRNMQIADMRDMLRDVRNA